MIALKGRFVISPDTTLTSIFFFDLLINFAYLMRLLTYSQSTP